MKNSSNKLIPASTVLIVRDGKNDLEVFMVVRHHEIDFASGALVFPGGKVDQEDLNIQINQFINKEKKINDEEMGFRIAGIRECYEEAGVLFANSSENSTRITKNRLSQLEVWRDRFNNKESSMYDFASQENLTFTVDDLIPYAHWITPDMMPKRFDTRFYIAEAPDGHKGLHDGGESVDSIWISPKRAIEDCNANKRTIIFPTRMNLEKLSKFDNVEDAITSLRKEEIVTVEPKIEKNDDGVFLTIPENAGYGKIREPIENLK